MPQHLGYITLVVRDYDEAIAFFIQVLSFDLIEDSPSTDRQGRAKRWVLIAPPDPTVREFSSPKPPTPKKPAASAIRQEAASSSFSTLTISGGTTTGCAQKE